MSFATEIQKRRPKTAAAPPPAFRNLGDQQEGPFRSFGEQLLAVREAELIQHSAGGTVDPRLFELQRRATAAAGSSEAVPGDGGFLVAPEFADRIATKILGTGEFLRRTDYYPVSGDRGIGKKIPGFDEQSRAEGSRFGGVRGYWENEADAATASKPKYRLLELLLKKLFALGYTTSEMLQDAALLGAAMEKAFVGELLFKAESACFSGTGAGQIFGLLNSPALVTVAAEAGQAPATVVSQNVCKMMGRMWGPSRKSAVWFVHADVAELLPFLTLTVGTAGSQMNLFRFAESDDDYDRLMGRPVIISEYAPALGTVGDIVLVDPSQFILSDRDGITSAISMHVRFLTDEQAFRFIWRVDGQPMWHTAVTPATGGNTLSPYVTLAAR